MKALFPIAAILAIVWIYKRKQANPTLKTLGDVINNSSVKIGDSISGAKAKEYMYSFFNDASSWKRIVVNGVGDHGQPQQYRVWRNIWTGASGAKNAPYPPTNYYSNDGSGDEYATLPGINGN